LVGGSKDKRNDEAKGKKAILIAEPLEKRREENS